MQQTRAKKEPITLDRLCRGGRIRTDDLFDPNEARYQAAPRPEVVEIIAVGMVGSQRFTAC